MANVIIKNTADFNTQLMKMLCEDEEETDKDNVCLIDGDSLKHNHIKLRCGHKFNYNPLFFELKNQKIPTNLEVTHLRLYDIKCPYCREVQKGVIKYDEELGIKADGINWASK